MEPPHLKPIQVFLASFNVRSLAKFKRGTFVEWKETLTLIFFFFAVMYVFPTFQLVA